MVVFYAIDTQQRLLVVDPSANHLAFVICTICPNGSFIIEKSGMLWTKDNWSLGRRLNYMKTSFLFLLKEFKIDKIYTEQFFMNPKILSGGTAVIPTVNAILQMCIDESGLPIDFEEIPPPSWRAVLGIKATITKIGAKTKRDFKEPTKVLVRTYIKPPETLLSNITGKTRDTPYDIYDALAIAIALSKKAKCVNLIEDKVIFDDRDLFVRLAHKSDEDIMKGRFFKNAKD